jgi:MFS family permease
VRVSRFRFAANPLPPGNFRLLWVGQTGSALGDAITIVVLAFALFDIGASVADLSLTLAVLALARVASVLVGGAVADRFGGKAVAIAADLVRGSAQGVLAFLLMTDVAQPWHFACASAAVGLAGGFFAPAMTGIVRDTVPERHRQQANAWMSLSRSLAGIVGPALGGVLLVTFGSGSAFAFDAATFMLSAVALAFARTAPRHHPLPVGLASELRTGFRMLGSLKWVSHSILIFAVANLASATFFVAGPAVAASHYGGASDWGLILSVAAIGGLVGGAAAIRFTARNPLLAAFRIALLMPLQMVSLGLVLPLPLVLIAGAITVGARTVTNALWDTSIQNDVPGSFVSRVSSYDWFVSLALYPVGLAMAGPMVLYLGPQLTLTLAGVVSLIAYAIAQFDPVIMARGSHGHQGSTLAARSPVSGDSSPE